MSNKSTIFLTKDNEHCYEDTSLPKQTVVLEISKKNVEILLNDDDNLILEFHPDSQIYNELFFV